jgi:hypothetical protein
MSRSSRLAPVTAADPLVMRLNTILYPHANAPFHIKNLLVQWQEVKQEKLSDVARHLELYRNLERHIEPLMKHAYRDQLENNFVDLRADKQLDAEYGLLRRLVSLAENRASLIEDHECEEVLRVLQAAGTHLLNYPWNRADLPPFRFLARYGGAPQPRPVYH